MYHDSWAVVAHHQVVENLGGNGQRQLFGKNIGRSSRAGSVLGVSLKSWLPGPSLMTGPHSVYGKPPSPDRARICLEPWPFLHDAPPGGSELANLSQVHGRFTGLILHHYAVRMFAPRTSHLLSMIYRSPYFVGSAGAARSSNLLLADIAVLGER